MTKEQIVRLLELTAYNVYGAALKGGERDRLLVDELHDPKPGDLCFEMTSLFMTNTRGLCGIGRLIKTDMEAYCTEEEAKEKGYEEGEPIPLIKVWYIALEFDDGRTFRWTNAKFIKIKEDIA